jgi:hypothetical protein
MAVRKIWPINVRLDKFIASVVTQIRLQTITMKALQNLLAYDTTELKTEKKLSVPELTANLKTHMRK